MARQYAATNNGYPDFDIATVRRDGLLGGYLRRLNLVDGEVLCGDAARRIKPDQDCNLVDCLQPSDKAQVMAQDPESLASFGFTTRTWPSR